MREIRAIIPAAGKGKRLQGVCGDIPKAMVRVNGRPMLEVVLENTGFIDADNTFIVVGHGQEMIRDYFPNTYHYVEQLEQLGTGHAVQMCAQAFEGFDGIVLVTFGDMPLFRREDMEKMCKQHAASDASCTLMTAENPNLKLWARVVRDEEGNFAGIVEGKDCTSEQAKIKELFSGVIVFDSRALFEMLPLLSCANAQGELYLTEVPELMLKHNMKIDTYPIKDGSDLHGVNTPEDLVICERLLRERNA